MKSPDRGDAPLCYGDEGMYSEANADCRFCPFRVQCCQLVMTQPAGPPAPPPPPPPPAYIAPPPPPPPPTPARVAPQPTQGAPVPPPRAYAQTAQPTYAQPAAAPQYTTNYGGYYRTPATQPAAAPPPPASALIRPARFNHNQNLVGQYTSYVMYDVAEVLVNRAGDLIRSCRDEYVRELFEEENK